MSVIAVWKKCDLRLKLIDDRWTICNIGNMVVVDVVGNWVYRGQGYRL